jgi:hypothetical protein
MGVEWCVFEIKKEIPGKRGSEIGGDTFYAMGHRTYREGESLQHANYSLPEKQSTNTPPRPWKE